MNESAYRQCISSEIFKANKSVESLRKNQIWFSDPKAFNDPLDCIPPIAYSGSRDNQWVPTHMRATISNTYRVVCLTERNDNTQMWSHYASHHTGFCIEFDTSYEPFSDALRVRYTHKPIAIDVSMEGSLDKVKQQIFSLKPPKIGKAQLEKIENIMLTTKARDWAHEREWRIIRRMQWGPVTNGEACPLQENSITAVYVGVAMPKIVRQWICGLIKRSSRTQLFAMKWSKDGFHLIPEKIEWADAFMCD